MTWRVFFDPSAEDEVEEAKAWYARRNPEAAARFVQHVRQAVSAVAEAPERWPEIEPEVRRFVLRKFPYSLIYAIEGEHVLVLSVAHQRRQPGYWRDRR